MHCANIKHLLAADLLMQLYLHNAADCLISMCGEVTSMSCDEVMAIGHD
jgi:hypothetical protein